MTLGLQKQWPTIDGDLNRKLKPELGARLFSGDGVVRMKTCHSGSKCSDMTAHDGLHHRDVRRSEKKKKKSLFILADVI